MVRQMVSLCGFMEVETNLFSQILSTTFLTHSVPEAVVKTQEGGGIRIWKCKFVPPPPMTVSPME